MFGLRSARPATERLDPGDHLGEVERLGEVIIGAQAETLDPVLDRTGRGEHQDPARRALGGQGAADLVAVGAGEVAVQHHHAAGRADETADPPSGITVTLVLNTFGIARTVRKVLASSPRLSAR